MPNITEKGENLKNPHYPSPGIWLGLIVGFIGVCITGNSKQCN